MQTNRPETRRRGDGATREKRLGFATRWTQLCGCAAKTELKTADIVHSPGRVGRKGGVGVVLKGIEMDRAPLQSQGRERLSGFRFVRTLITKKAPLGQKSVRAIRQVVPA